MRVIDEGFETLELVHRLDRDTSGCLLFARNLPDVRRLHEAMKQGEIKKSYTALLAGRMQKKPCQVDKPLLKNTLTGGERRVEVNKHGKAALTVFKPERVFRDTTLVDIDLLTGRTHQIRVHSASIGCPVVGDRKYGDKEVNSVYRQKGLKRLFLHASQLQFESPATHKQVIVDAPMDEQLLEVIDTLS